MNLIFLASVSAAIFATATGTSCDDESTCATGEVCAGPDDTKVCADDPCNPTNPTNPCGAHGDCTPDLTTQTPSPICTCKEGYGGETCGNAPECTTMADCTDTTKPECKKEDGKQSVCVAGSGGGTPCNKGDCKNFGSCPESGELPCTCIDNFTGDTCDIAPACTKSDCENDGTCTADGKLPCTCKDGYTGNKCEKGAGNLVAATPGLVMTLLLAAIYL